MAKRRTRGKPLSRKEGTRLERRTVVVFCEGLAAEPDYVKALKKLPEVRQNTAINIEIDPDQGVPLTLVKRAVDRKEHDDEVDECWCLFDVEWPTHHPNLHDAVQLAEANGVLLAISNPCFELWLILHVKNHTAFLQTPAAKSMCRKLAGQRGERIEPAKYMPHLETAAKRAVALTERHLRNGTAFPKDNPSSTMYEFLVAIKALPASFAADGSGLKA